MEKDEHDNATRAHEEFQIARARLRGLATVLGCCAVSDAPLGALEANCRPARWPGS